MTHNIKLCLILLASLFFLDCHSSSNGPVRPANSALDKEAVHSETHQFQTTVSPLTESQREVITKSVRIHQIFPVERVVRLRESQAIVAEVSDLAFVDDQMFIVDEIQKLVFQFDVHGTFVRQVGGRGSGPGEYELPRMVRAVWGRQVAVLDSTGRMLLYDTQGKNTATLKGVNGLLLPRGAFEWPAQSHFYATDFYTQAIDAYKIRIYDLTDPAAPKLTGAFQKRFDVSKLINYARNHGAFCMVGEHIWTSSPYEAVINIYDKNGTHLKRVPLPAKNPLAFEDFQDAAGKHHGAKAIFKALRDKESIDQIVFTGSLVVLRTSHALRLFEPDGTPIGNRIYAEVGKLLGVYNGMLVTEINNMSVEDGGDVYYQAIPRAYKMMQAQGFDMNNPGDDLYLRFAKMVP